MTLQWVIGPLVGGAIGLLTNSVAIRMLFRPLNAHYIGKFQIPLTPGLIPKEKARIAHTIGDVISGELLSEDVLDRTLTSDVMIERLRGAMDRFFLKYRDEERTVRQILSDKLGRPTVDTLVNETTTELSSLIEKKLASFDFGAEIAAMVLAQAREKLGWFGKIADGKMADSIAKHIGGVINDAIRENSHEILETLLCQEIEKLFDQRACDLYAHYEDKLPGIKDMAIEWYRELIRRKLPRMLRALNLAQVVEDRIASYDTLELEKMILSIMKKELNAIVWLGGLLGFLMGFINVLL